MSTSTVTISRDMLILYQRHLAIFEQLKKEYEMAIERATKEVKTQQEENKQVFYSHLSDSIERVDSLVNNE